MTGSSISARARSTRWCRLCSGRQNIAEGSRASASSSQTELRLVNVARVSLDELLLDYEDFLRQRRLPLWDKHGQDAQRVRKLGRVPDPGQRDQTDPADPTAQIDVFGPYAAWLNHEDPAIVAKAVICLIHQANYLLDRQIAGLERNFVQEGGYSERLPAARIAVRERQRDGQDSTGRAQAELPDCPLCGKPMVLRTVQGKKRGRPVLGCAAYPACKGSRSAEGPRNWTDRSDPTDPSDDARGNP